MERPLLKPWYRLSTNGGRSVLRYAGSVLEFEGRAAERLLPHLLPLLDGTRTVDDVVAGWSDLPFAGQVGGLDGRVWNGNIGQGVMGILVAAVGRHQVTHGP